MNFSLTDYQSDVVRSVLTRYRNARSLWSDDRALTAIGLTAPTGAGKTVIASAVLEKLIFGTEASSPNPNLTVLWLTDDPSLNEQSKDKIKLSSSLIQDSQLVTLDSGFDQPELPVGKICFLNIQRLGTGASGHIATGDGRQHSFWEILANTVRNRPNDFLLVVDEAHRGASIKAGDKKTIMRTVMDGGTVDYPNAAGQTRTATLPPAPIVLGISATPVKFEAAIDSTNRNLMKVSADIAMVRESGMVKDLINLAYSADDQSTDDTLLRMATRDLIASRTLWAQQNVASKRSAPPVEPIMVVQVPDRTTDATLAGIVESILEEWPKSDTGAPEPISFAHAFGEHTDIALDGGTVIRYIAPPAIQGHRDIRVVFFKTALTTGWDCPRAEVMVSMRAAKDFTSIAQLMGRMVRTPLARRITDPGLEELNSVVLYLPHYDRDQVAKVVESFSGDADMDVEVSINPITFPRREGVSDTVWESILPKELKPVRKPSTETARAAALATTLDFLGVANPAGANKFEESVRKHLMDTLLTAYRAQQAELDEKAAGYQDVTFERIGVDGLSGSTGETSVQTLAVSVKNIRQLRDAAIRRMPDASGKWLYIELLDLCDNDELEASALVAAIGQHEPAIKALEEGATAHINMLRQQLKAAVGSLAREDRASLDRLWHPPTKPTVDDFSLPAVEKARTQRLDKATKDLVDIPFFDGHLFTDEKGFPMTATSWEVETIEKIRTRHTGFQGWYRNPAKASGLSVAYEDANGWKLLYPDFLAFYHTAAGLRVDIVDPHNHALADTSAKWSALARYARTYADMFGQVLAVIKRGEVMWSLELGGSQSEDIELALSKSTGAADIEAVFEQYGGTL